jgi:hypothetical protein
MSEKQNAVDWLVEQIKEYDFSPRDNTYLIEIPSWIFKEKIDIAKKMEKGQIIDAYLTSNKYKFKTEAEKYYKETFNK